MFLDALYHKRQIFINNNNNNVVTTYLENENGFLMCYLNVIQI